MSEYASRENLPRLVNEYISELIVVHAKSPLTVNEYISDLRLFFRYLVSQKQGLHSPTELPEDYDLTNIDVDFINKITLKDAHSFLIYCSEERNNGVSSRARKASSIRGFFKYISEKMQYIDHNPVSQLQVAYKKNRLPKYLSLEESVMLLEAVKGKDRDRDYCILTLFLNCGLRLAELVSLNITDINFNTRTIRVIGKGNKERMIYLNDACVSALKAYLYVRPKDKVDHESKNALFLSRLNKRIGRQAVQLMVYKYLADIGLDGQNYSVHKLRHTAATLMYQHGDVDTLVLKEILGHENLNTTEIYTHLENKQLRDALNQNPLSTIKAPSLEVEKRRENADTDEINE